MLLHVGLTVGGLALLSALLSHLRRNKRVSGGVVLSAMMLTLQAVVHPPGEQAIAQQFEEEDEQESGEGNALSLKLQMLRQARRRRRGEPEADLTLRLPLPGVSVDDVSLRPEDGENHA